MSQSKARARRKAARKRGIPRTPAASPRVDLSDKSDEEIQSIMQQAVSEMTPIQQQVVELQEFHIKNLQSLLEQASLRQQQDDQFLGNVVLATVEGIDERPEPVQEWTVVCTNGNATPVRVERAVEGEDPTDDSGQLILTVSRMTEEEWMAEFAQDEDTFVDEVDEVDESLDSPEVAEKLAALRAQVDAVVPDAGHTPDDQEVDAHPRGFVEDPAELEDGGEGVG